MPRAKKADLTRSAHVLEARKYAQWCASAGISFPEAEHEAIFAYRALIRLAEAIRGQSPGGTATGAEPIAGPTAAQWLGPQAEAAP